MWGSSRLWLEERKRRPAAAKAPAVRAADAAQWRPARRRRPSADGSFFDGDTAHQRTFPECIFLFCATADERRLGVAMNLLVVPSVQVSATNPKPVNGEGLYGMREF